MTNKYSELSDFEIEHLIAESRNGRKIDRGIGRDIFVPKICTHYHDAMQLMVDNGISILYHSDVYDAVYKYGEFNINKAPIRAVHENPCRAIAECFLLSKDAENG